MNKTVMTKTLFILFSVLLSACAQPIYKVDEAKTIGSLGSKTIVIVDDRRPESDKHESIGSILITSSDYGIWTLGDKRFDPNVIELLKYHVIKHVAKQRSQPKTIKITLQRLILQANHQATMLRSASQDLGPLGVTIAEAMHGKAFEMSIDKTQPFVLGFIDSTVTIAYRNKKSIKKHLSLSRAENFSSHMDEEGRKKASLKVVNDLMSAFSDAII